jgi:hypothetical protein
MREPAGAAGNGGRWENWEEYGENRPKLGVVAGKGPRASDWRCREVPALPIGSCRAAHLLGSVPRRHAFVAAGVDVFSAPNPNNAPAAFWEAFWRRRWRCSKTLSITYKHMAIGLFH